MLEQLPKSTCQATIFEIVTKGTCADSGLGMSESAQLSGREKGYTEVVQDLNKANLSRQKYDAVSAFAMVAAKDATGDSTIRCFDLVQFDNSK